MAHLVWYEKAGDPASAFEAARACRPGSYFGGEAGVRLKVELAERFGRGTVLTGLGDTPAQRELTPQYHAVNLGGSPNDHLARARAWLEEAEPTHLILNAEPELLAWAADRGLPVLPSFADTFYNPPDGSGLRALRERVGHWRYRRGLRKVLRRLRPVMALNHNLVGTQDLRRLCPADTQVEAYEVMDRTPLARQQVRTLPMEKRWTLLYVGRVHAVKGVGDLVCAAAELVRAGLDVELRVLGGGDLLWLAAEAERAGLPADRLHARGQVARPVVEAELERATLAVVPTRASYPEGLPLTLMEPLAIGLPVLATRHRAWASRLNDGVDAALADPSAPRSLAAKAADLLKDPELYTRLSRGGPAVFERLLHGRPLAELQQRWADRVLTGASSDTPATFPQDQAGGAGSNGADWEG